MLSVSLGAGQSNGAGAGREGRRKSTSSTNSSGDATLSSKDLKLAKRLLLPTTDQSVLSWGGTKRTLARNMPA